MSLRYDIEKGVKRTRTKTKRFSFSILAAGFALAALLVPMGAVLAHGGGGHWGWWKKNKHNVIVVKPSDLALPPNPFTIQKSWYFYDDNTDTPSTAEVPGAYEFVTGVDNPPLGYGSLKFNNTAGTERWNIATNQFAGKDIDDLNKLAMTIYRPASQNYSLFFNMDVDFDNTTLGGYQGRLVFVPDDNGTVNEDVWQKWDMDSGMWRWSGFASNGNKWLDGNTNDLRSWSDIVAAFPSAEVYNEGGVTGQTLVRAGHPGPAGLEGYLDSVTVNKKTYNFETDECVFESHGNRYKLRNNCETTQTILIPDGMTLDGRGHTITAVDPDGGHFLGAVVKNAGDEASVKNLKIKARDLSDVCDSGGDRLRGVMLDGASGTIENVKIYGVNQGDSGCQEGNGIEARNCDGALPLTRVTIHHNWVDDYQKTGILVNCDVKAKVKHNRVGSADLANFIAANSIQIGFGAEATVHHNKVKGNQWCGGGGWTATAMLVYQTGDVDIAHNYIYRNSDIGIDLYDYSGQLRVKHNVVKDQGPDCNADGWDIGISNYTTMGGTSHIRHNHIHGFDVAYEDYNP